MMDQLWYALAGLAAGVLSGMGLGGGTLLIPALTLLLGVGQHAAQGVNLLAFVPGALLALLIHKKGGRLQGKEGLKLLPAGIAGAIVGAILCSRVEGELLRRFYGGFLILLALSRVGRLKAKKPPEKTDK